MRPVHSSGINPVIGMPRRANLDRGQGFRIFLHLAPALYSAKNSSRLDPHASQITQKGVHASRQCSCPLCTIGLIYAVYSSNCTNVERHSSFVIMPGKSLNHFSRALSGSRTGGFHAISTMCPGYCTSVTLIIPICRIPATQFLL